MKNIVSISKRIENSPNESSFDVLILDGGIETENDLRKCLEGTEIHAQRITHIKQISEKYWIVTIYEE